MNNKKISSFRKRMNRSSQLTAEAIRKELLESRFIIQSHNKVKLEKSLSLTNDSYLVDKTLLTPSIHKVHSKSLFERYIKHSNTDKHKKYKFLTLLDSVEILDEKRILKREKGEYQAGMYGLFGQHWKRLSRIFSIYNVPMEAETRYAVQKMAENKVKQFKN